VDNPRIARAFHEMADLCDLAGESAFKGKAYRAFADKARTTVEPIAGIAARGELKDMEGVGPAIARKVDELLATGTFAALERMRAAVPAGAREVLRLPGIGAKTARILWQSAGITSLRELAEACEKGALAGVPGLGARKQEKILAAAREALEGEGAMLLAGAREVARRVASAFPDRETVLVGSGRRGVEIVKDATIHVRRGEDIARTLVAQAGTIDCFGVETVDGEVHARFQGNALVRVRAIGDADWVLRLIEETGSEAHLRWLEGLARAKGGLPAICRAAAREEDVYAALGIPFAPPELREGPAAEVGPMLEAVAGAFHVHSNWSDGTASIVDMARNAKDAGYTYMGLSDHSQAASYANGLDARRLEEQREAIDVARREVDGIAILHGVEVDILDDGTLDLDDATLAKLDFVIASVHSRHNMKAEEMTARIVRAVSHPLVTMLGHPTGRLLLGRKGSEFDIARVARAAAANDTYLEINANSQRMDLDDALVRRAAGEGARFVINPDAHAPTVFRDIELGVIVARRAALDPARVLNTQSAEEIVRTLAERREKGLRRLT
jgi:DNA polymerase (family 10)